MVVQYKNMDIQKIITLIGDRLRLSFLVGEDNKYIANKAMIWFENEEGRTILGDNYDYYINYKLNKKEIKESLKLEYPNGKGLFKEFKSIMEKMKEYES